MKIQFLITYLLQNKSEVIKHALQAKLPKDVVHALLLMSALSFAVFGFMIGSSHSAIQGAFSMVKLPFLFYATGLICFPTLYIFLALLGITTSIKGIAQFSLLAIFIMSIILISFAPVSLFFLVVGTHYQIYKLLNVGMMAIAGCSGVYLFHKYILHGVDMSQHPGNTRRVNFFIRCWLLMFGLIGANLGFTLSPIFGDPNEPLIFFTSADQNFFSHLTSVFRSF